MPSASLRFVRAAWTWCAIGLVLGALLVLARSGVLPPCVLVLRGTHVHTLLVGFLLQWIFGVAFWIYPASASERRSPRTDSWMRACWLLLNGGTLLRGGCEPWMSAATAGALASAGLLAGAGAQLVAGILFILMIRSRIRGPGWIREVERGSAGRDLGGRGD